MEREIIEVDVVYVGGGPASLSSALYLKKLVKDYNNNAKKQGKKEIKDPEIIILEKGTNLGSHTLSGAILDIKSLKELFPEIEKDKKFPYESKVIEDKIYFLTKNSKLPVLFAPPSMHNKGHYIVSLGKIVKWLGELVEKEEIEVFTEFSGNMLLEENGKIVGVRTGDKGIDKEGKPKDNFEPGVDIKAKITVLGEGTRGYLTKKLIKEKNLDKDKNPICYATGVKEIWKLPENRFPKGKVIHTLGWPLKSYQFGGGFIYGLDNNKIAIGFVVGLDYKDPFTDPHRLLQIYKTHPYIKSILEGGELEKYGAKTIPEGGFWSIPKLYGDGFLIIGDSAGLVNTMRLKGIHLAIKSGLLAAETILEALIKDDSSADILKIYEDKFKKSWAYKELWKVRNFRQSYHKSLFRGLFHTSLQLITLGRGLFSRYRSIEDHKTMKKIKDIYKKGIKEFPKSSYSGDKKLTFDKLTSVYYSGTKHEENQPCHLKVKDTTICITKCKEEYGNPCQYFCPANVYEIVEENGKLELKINFSNCLHCKTCDIIEPYELIEWVPPEGGGGPNYSIM